MTNSAVRAKSLVVDSAPLLKGERIERLAEKLFTTPDVIAEMRSQHARDFLASNIELKQKLQIIEPDEASLAAVSAFARATGDYASLSLADLRVLALTYYLDKQAHNGDVSHLKTKPGKPAPGHASNNAATTTTAEAAATTTTTTTSDVAQPAEKQQEPTQPAAPRKPAPVAPWASLTAVKQKSEEAVEKLADDVAKLPLDDNKATDDAADQDEDAAEEGEDDDDFELASDDERDLAAMKAAEAEDVELVSESEEDDAAASQATEPVEQQPTAEKEVEEKEQGNDDDLFDDGWITPKNIQKHRQREYSGSSGKDSNISNEPLLVACATGDFAMQNVILQMGLNLLSTDGNVVKQLKTWVLRCHACYTTTSEMDRQFCPSCGNATLIRTSCSVDANGKLKVYLKKNFQYRLRGTVYSIPAPVVGGPERHKNANIILREDQKEYQRAMQRRPKSKASSGSANLLDPDYLDNLLSSKQGAPAETFGLGYDASYRPIIGYGRRNPNEKRRARK
ncbi:hypothetical protein GQ42DRAFT_165868 [Ramicandelaber brevisporus]|nr:hypothetical protein GQ42DRAFT_165868 [Ramicandelaber brevisporus]